MNTLTSKLISTTVFFLLIFLTGFWLSRTQKPYPVMLFTLHKLIALAAVVFLAVIVNRVHQAAPLSALQWVGIVVSAVCLLATIITGGLLSLEQVTPAILRSIHHLAPYLTVISVAVTLYLLFAVGSQLAPA
jgi:hypothetical protein